MIDLIERHFAAINARDYEGWANTVTSRRAVDQSPDRWAQSYRSTRDSAVVISSIRETGADSLVTMLSFISEQDVADTWGPRDHPPVDLSRATLPLPSVRARDDIVTAGR